MDELKRDRSFAHAMFHGDRANGCWVTYVSLTYGERRSLCCKVIWVFGCDRNLPVK
ncbi:hypothetical protein [Limnofasciculus baicalensis]|uniref:Uncharacterized protein n=1 Tax=Limnofasciculus baicalensis BBK-W-15 TaxID=2699891 RepID=A0AAE3GSW6_9CYAN|nr:hypothetical protein [Limnofasciculus baicalensis]MCP2729351.1 hypothetical protein [Limnofasciculus baicalensis BBK-W-15]